MTENLIGQAVTVTLEGGFTHPGVAERKGLTYTEKFSKLTKEQQEEILTGIKTVDDFYQERDETPIEGIEALRDTCKFIDTFKAPVEEAEKARKVLTVQRLAEGDDPADIKAMTGVTFATLKSWCAPTFKGTTTQLVDKRVLTAIDRVSKAAKNGKTT